MDGLLGIAGWAWAPLILAAGAAVYFLILPLLARKSYAQPANPPFSRFELRTQRLPSAVRTFFDDTAVELEPLGFSSVCGLFVGRHDAERKAIVLLLQNRSTRDVAIALAAYSAARNRPRLEARIVEFACRFDDRAELRTNNSRDLPALAPLPGCSVHRLPIIEAAADLHAIHQRLAARSGPSREKSMPDLSDPAMYMKQSLAEELQGQVSAGHAFLDRETDQYRLTLKGALLAGWSSCWPVRWLRAAARDREAKRLLALLQSGPRVAPKVALTRLDKSG